MTIAHDFADAAVRIDFGHWPSWEQPIPLPGGILVQVCLRGGEPDLARAWVSNPEDWAYEYPDLPFTEDSLHDILDRRAVWFLVLNGVEKLRKDRSI